MTIRNAIDHLDAPRGRTYDSILETVGHTPLVRLNRIAQAAGGDVRGAQVRAAVPLEGYVYPALAATPR